MVSGTISPVSYTHLDVYKRQGEINVAWFMYEFVALAIPMKHVHAPGKCNKAMTSKWSKHMRTTPDDDMACLLYTSKLFSSSRLVSGLSGCSLSQVYCQFSLGSSRVVPAVQWSMSRGELSICLLYTSDERYTGRQLNKELFSCRLYRFFF